MDIVDAIVILGVAGIAAASLYFYVTFTSKVQKEMQEYQQQNITLRAQNRPREWWQELLVEAVKNPVIVDKMDRLIPALGQPQVQQLILQKLQGK